MNLFWSFPWCYTLSILLIISLEAKEGILLELEFVSAEFVSANFSPPLFYSEQMLFNLNDYYSSSRTEPLGGARRLL